MLLKHVSYFIFTFTEYLISKRIKAYIYETCKLVEGVNNNIIANNINFI